MSPALLATIALAVLLTASWGTAPDSIALAAPSHPALQGPVAPTAVPSTAIVTGGSVRGATTQFVNGTFFGANSTFADTAPASWPCSAPAWQNFTIGTFLIENESSTNCYGGAQNPSLVTLANGNLGVAYSVFTTNETSCSQYGTLVVGRIGFQVSADGGKTYGAARYLGNQTCSNLQAIEPSFASSSNGDLYGVFVQENNTSRNSSTGNGLPLPYGYGDRPSDSFGFLRSTNSGATFSTVTTIAAAGGSNIARPQIATFGNSVYIVYDHLNNWTNLTLPQDYGYAPAGPISVELVYSSNGGTTWNGPYVLPGLNGSQGFTSQSPSVSVSTAGKLAVAYATNRGCFVGSPRPCEYYGESIVVSTSSTNGTSWSLPTTIAPSVGETQCQGFNNQTAPNYWYFCYAYQFQMSPETSVAWSGTNASYLYVAWSGLYNWTDYSGASVDDEVGNGGVWSATSANGGVSWAMATVNAPEPFLQFDPDFSFYPVLTVHAGTVYLAYSVENQSYCPSSSCPFSYSFSYYLTNSTDGLRWTSPALLALDPIDPYEIFDAWTGYNDAVAFNAGHPVVSFAMPLVPVQSTVEITTHVGPTPDDHFWFNDTGQTALTVASVWTGSTTPITMTETGLRPGVSWGFSLGPVNVATSASSVVIGDVPLSQPLLLLPGPAGSTGEYRTIYAPSDPAVTVLYSGPATQTVAYTIEYGLVLSILPPSINDFNFYFSANGTYYNYDLYSGTAYISPAFPWYFASGTAIPFGGSSMYSSVPISYYNGTGNGSSTTTGNRTSITMNGPINETLWGGAFGAYDVTFSPGGLTASESYHFVFNGTPYQAAGTTNVSVPDVLTGAYGLSAIEANGSAPGWEYFGQASSGSPVVVPDETDIALNFSFAYVDVAAAAGTVSFHATGLASGDVWRISFNGTQYASANPWINVTTRPGTFGVQSFPIPASANDSTNYAPGAFGPTVSVTPGSSYTVPFTNAYRVQAYAGNGGTITGGGTQWLAPGSFANFSATAKANYVFLGWAGQGAGSYTGSVPNASIVVGGPIIEAATFEPLPVNRFNLTFSAVGLPTGTWWTVDLNGSGYATNGASLRVAGLFPCSSGAGGNYALAVPYVYLNGTTGIRYVPRLTSTTVCTTGTTVVPITFSPEYLITPLSTTGGAASLELSGIPATSPTWVPTGTVVGLQVSIDAGYSFTGWVGSGRGNYTGPFADQVIVPAGPVTEAAYFQLVVVPPPSTYDFSFTTTTSLVAGTAWSVVVDGVGHSSTTSWINLTGLSAGTHPISVGTPTSPDGLTRYTPSSPPATISLPSQRSLSLAFRASYWVEISATAGGTVAGAASGFFSAGKSLQLNASPDDGQSFAGWLGTGAGSYSGSESIVTVTVDAPLTELASFAVVPASVAPAPSSPLSSAAALVGLGVVGLAIGLAAGIVMFRRRARPPTAEAAPEVSE